MPFKIIFSFDWSIAFFIFFDCPFPLHSETAFLCTAASFSLHKITKKLSLSLLFDGRRLLLAGCGSERYALKQGEGRSGNGSADVSGFEIKNS